MRASRIFLTALISVFGFTLISSAAIPDTLWTKTYGGGDNDFGFCVQQTTDGGFIIAGETNSYGADLSNVFLVKIDSDGDTLWTQTFGGDSYDEAKDVKELQNGGYIIAGRTESYGSGAADVWLIKTDLSGDTLWTKTFGGSQIDLGNSVLETSDGGFIIAGYTESFGSGSQDVYVIKTNINGDTTWTKTFGAGDGDIARSIQQTLDGGYIIGGYTYSFGSGVSDAYLIKIDENGNEEWSQPYGSSSYEHCFSVQQTSDGGYVLAGQFGSGAKDYYLVKTDSNGNAAWTKTFGGENTDIGETVKQTSDGGYIIGGYSSSYGSGSYDIYLIKTDTNGDSIWSKTIGGTGDDRASELILTPENEFIIAGQTSSYGSGNSDVYLVKLEPEPLSGPLSGTLEAGVYHVGGSITVDAGDSLIIEPGTTFLFDGDCAFDIDGYLYAVGNGIDSIKFMPDIGTDSWGGIDFNDSSDDNNELGYCVVTGSNSSGIYFSYANPLITNCRIIGNSSSTLGGGIYCNASSPGIINCTIQDNICAAGGGGIFCFTNSSPIIRGCLITGNSSTSPGGGIATNGESVSLDITNCTIGNNIAVNHGGGIDLSSTGDCMILNSIISNNSPDGIYYSSQDDTVKYCNVFNNSSVNFSGTPPANLGAITTTNANGDPCDVYNNIFLDPLFPWSDNAEYLLTENSPCIDAGDPASPLDPDGTTADIGAYPYFQNYSSYIHHVPSMYPTIQAAIDACSEGDTVLIADYVWTGAGNKILNPGATNIVIMSENGPENCIIDAEGAGRAFEFGSSIDFNTVVSGITVRNCFKQSASGGAVNLSYASPQFINCRFIDNIANGGDGGAINSYYGNPYFESCLFQNNNSLGTAPGGALSIVGSDSAKIYLCTFIDNSSEAASGGAIKATTGSDFCVDKCVFIGNSSGYGGGAMIIASSSGEITNCTFTGNFTTGNGSAITTNTTASWTLKNCVISGGTGNGALYIASADSANIEYCDFHNNENGDFTGTPPANLGAITTTNANGDPCDVYSNIFLDPLFTDPASDDYTLTATSPCIDAGDPASPPDPDGTTADMGAYYYHQDLLTYFEPDGNTVALWHCNEGTGTTAYDATGNGLDGTLNGSVAWSNSGAYGACLDCQADNSSISVPDNDLLDITDQITIDAMIYPIAYETSTCRNIIAKPEGIIREWCYFLGYGDGGGHNGIIFMLSDPDANSHSLFWQNDTLTLNTWYHIAATYDGNYMRLYFEDMTAPVAQSQTEFEILTSVEPLYIAYHVYNNDDWGFNGMIDEIRISNTVRYTPESVTRHVPSEYTTIQAAIDACFEGDTVLVADGTYIGVGNKNLDPGGVNIVIMSESGNPEDCIIDCEDTGRGFKIHSNEDLTTVIKGLSVINGYYASDGGGIYIVDSDATIENCIINNCQATSGGGIGVQNGSPIINKCQFTNNSATSDGGGIVLYQTGQTSINNCTFSQNSAAMIGTGTVRIAGDHHPSFTNCIFEGNSSNNLIMFDGTNASELIYNNFWNNGTEPFAGGNIPANLGIIDTTNANGDPCDQYFNIFMDPLFVDAAGGDYHLTAASPCIDAGDPASDPDPDGTTADIGCYYFDQDDVYSNSISISGSLDNGTDDMFTDNSNYAGLHLNATDGHDPAFDIPEPAVPPSDYLSIYFPHPEWSYILGDNFMTDLRNGNDDLTNEVKIYNFDVSTDQTGFDVNLTFETGILYPPDYGIVLNDTLTGYFQNIRENPNFTFNASQNITGLALRLGDGTPPVIDITSPAASSVYTPDQTMNIGADYTDVTAVRYSKLYYSVDNGQNYTYIDSLAGEISNYSWAVPAEFTEEGRIKIEAEDWAGNLGAGESETFTIQPGDPPVVEVLTPGEDELLIFDLQYSLDWTTTTTAALDCTVIEYSLNAGQDWTEVTVIEGGADDSFLWTVPSQFSVYAKIRIQATDEYGLTGSGTTGSTFNIAPDYSQLDIEEGWHLLSIPLNPADNSIAAIFGDDITSPFWVYSYTQTGGGYSLVNTVVPGFGYWLATTPAFTIDIEGTPNVDTVYTSLEEGYFMVGNGIPTAIPVDSLLFRDASSTLTLAEAMSNSWVLGDFFLYDNAGGSYTLADQMDIWDGCWLYVNQTGLQMIAYPPYPGTAVVELDEEDNNLRDLIWEIPITLISEERYDELTAFGVHPHATGDYDIFFDASLPPTPPSGNYLRAVFQREGFSSPAGDRFCKDIRKTLNRTGNVPQAESWVFTIESSDNGQITVNLPDIMEILPRGFAANLQCEETTLNLRDVHSFSFVYTGPMEVTITVYNRAATALGWHLGGAGVNLPTEYAIENVYPNPFNPAANIEIGLPEAGDLSVIVYNIMGQQVDEICDGYKYPGYHHFVFEAGSLSSGIYFVRAVVPGKMNEMRKIMLVK